MLVGEAIAEYQRQRTAEGVAPATQAHISKCMSQFATTCARRGVRIVQDITPSDVDAHLAGLMERGLLLTSRRAHAAVLIACCARWHTDGLIARNPALALSLQDDGDTPLPEAPLEPAEVASLLAALSQRDVLDLRNRTIVEVLYGCALRLSECLHLDVDDIDIRQRTLTVRIGKGGVERTVPLMKGALGALRDYLSLRRHLVVGPDMGALFLNNRGQRIGPFVVQDLLKQLGKRAGIERRVHPHLLRHSIAVSLLRGGADIKHVQSLLGHASMETTKIYLRMVPGHLREEYDAAMPIISIQPVNAPAGDGAQPA